MYAVTFMGYWAYGSNTSAYLLNNVNGPIWLKTLANISAFLQTIIALHVSIILELDFPFCCSHFYHKSVQRFLGESRLVLSSCNTP